MRVGNSFCCPMKDCTWAGLIFWECFQTDCYVWTKSLCVVSGILWWISKMCLTNLVALQTTRVPKCLHFSKIWTLRILSSQCVRSFPKWSCALVAIWKWGNSMKKCVDANHSRLISIHECSTKGVAMRWILLNCSLRCFHICQCETCFPWW